MNIRKLFAMLVLAALGGSAFAAETTGAQAETATRNWIRRHGAPLSTKLSPEIKESRTVRNGEGRALFHAVGLKGGGYVVTSGDTEVAPIVAFSESGDFEASSQNPLFVLLSEQVGRAVLAADAAKTKQPMRLAATPSGSVSGSATKEAEDEWESLLDDMSVMSTESSTDTDSKFISDMRVDPLCPTQWSQQGWNGYGKAFNYYTTNGYPCGCTATATAQLMYRWKKPTKSMSPQSFYCAVDGVGRYFTTRGGTYAWSTMPKSMVTQPYATLAERESVGHLLYDVGVALKSKYSAKGTGSIEYFIPGVLKDYFGYAESKCYFAGLSYGSDVASRADVENGVYASLDAGMPVLLSIHEPLDGTKSGHCVVLDGYGYVGTARWTHLNAGWAGKSDAWYRFFTEPLTDLKYTYLQGYVFNSHPDTKGDVISGRVLDHTGAPVSGATVTCTSGGTTQTTTSNARGIYYFRVTSSAKYVLKATKGGRSSSDRSTSVSIGGTVTYSVNNTSSGWSLYNLRNTSVGNRWGQNLVLAEPEPVKLTIVGESTIRSGESQKYEADVTYSDGTTKRVTASSAWELTRTAASSTIGNTSGNKGLLSVGTTYDSGLYVTVKATYDTVCASLSDTKDVTIIPLVKERVFNALVISGKSSLEGGASSDYVATAYFDDGSSMTVTKESTWSISSGSAYGEVGAKTGRLQTYATTEKGRVITLKASYTYGGVTLPATKDVSITFTASLRAPASLTVEGNSRVTAGTTSPYAAKVTYNDGSSAYVTLDSSWSLSTGAGYGKISRDETSSRAVLTAYGFSGSSSRTVTVKAEYAEGSTNVSGTKVVEIVPGVTIPEAVDVEKDGTLVVPGVTFTTGSTLAGGNCWFGQKTFSYSDGDAAQSGFMTGSYGQNWLEATVDGAGSFSFWWNVSSEPTYDHLKFEIDGIEKARISGTNSVWQNLVYELPAGTHKLRWTYVKDEINDRGQDAGWVDKVEWKMTAAPLSPSVTATDGTREDAVLVSWSMPPASESASKFKLVRKLKAGGSWETLVESTVDTAYLDKTAVAGRDYTYGVQAYGLAGWGSAGTDDGWRKIALAVTPDAFDVTYDDARAFSAAVTTEVAWAASADAWLTLASASGAGNGAVRFAVGACTTMAGRGGTLTVTAGGAEVEHKATATVSVTQAGRPAENDIGFVPADISWRTRLQISTSDDGTYNPTSVFTTAEAEAGDYRLSFGWTNRGERAVSMPSVRFRCLDPDRRVLLEWTEPARAAESLERNRGTWSANWQCDVVRVLDPGDYMIEAVLDPDNTLHDIRPEDNTAVFRFAVRDPALDAADVFDETVFTNLTLKAGSDFAQAPHLAFRPVTNEAARTMVQFGPYVPMNGVSVTGGKGALDIVFLIDVTGSMSGCINGLKTNIKSFFASLITGADAVTDWRAKVVGYRDITCDKSWFEDHGFTTDVGALNGQIADCYATGGGDGPESLLDALCRISSESDFREGAARVIVAFTDAPEKQPMSYGVFKDGGITETQTALTAHGVALWLVATSYGYGSGNFQELCDGVVNSALLKVGSLETFTGDTAKLKELAGSIGKIVPTTVVEPMATVSTRGLGTLRFKWCNDSTAGEDNVMTFKYDDGSDVLTCEAGSGWQDVELALTNSACAGWHSFTWNYGKTNYVGAVTDCGLVSDVVWEPVGTKLAIDPDKAFFTWDTLDKNSSPRTPGSTVQVTCNSIWKSSTDAAWLHLVRGTGDGDGELYFEVETNTAYKARSATITVRAGEYGLPTDEIVEKKIYVVQDESPVLPNGQIQILSVDVKPRWPWNEWVDIDFRIVPPAEGTEVEISFLATNVEGRVCRGDFAYIHGKGYSYCVPYSGASSYFKGDGVTPGKTSAKCTTSGVYRVSWQMDGGNRCWESTTFWNEGFHSPEVIFVLHGQATGVAPVVKASDPVRIDLRNVGASGGLVMSGVERIGHPDGWVDPIWVDTTEMSNGWNDLKSLFADVGISSMASNNQTTACVVNDAYVEGGTITNDTVWKADRIHVVRDNVFVTKGATLTIEDGAILKFCQTARIYSYTDATKKTAGNAYCNLRMKGVYCTGGYDNYYGVDILRAGEVGKAARGSGWRGSTECLYAAGFSSAATGQMVGSGEISTSSDKAVKKILFYCPLFNEDGSLNTESKAEESNSFMTRFYTRGETWGVLPKPCEGGQEFFGWFKESVTQNFMEGKPPVLSKTKYANNASKYKLDPTTEAWSFTKDQVYGLMAKESYFSDNVWPKDDADAASTIITIEPESVVYNGAVQKPTVTSVMVSGVTIPPENYDVDWGAGGFVNAGEYPVAISFKHDYTGHPSTTFTILPCPVDDAVVTFYYDTARPGYPTAGADTDRVWYQKAGVEKPKVRVRVGGKTMPEGDYTVTWRDEGWPAIGTYAADIVFNGNYVGAASGTFTIERNPDYEVVWYGDRATVAGLVNTWKRADGTSRRILYLGGRDSDIPTRLVKNYIEKDAEIYNFVIDNFVCWYDDCDAAGTAFGTYSRGLDAVSLPLVAVVSANNWDGWIDRFDGLVTREELKSFLEAAAVAAEDASEATVTLSASIYTYDGYAHRPTVSVSYGGKTVPAANYDVTYAPSDCIAVGDYAVTVGFKGTYLGYPIGGTTAPVHFRINAKPIEDGEVVVMPARAEYNGAEQKPTVVVAGVSASDYVVSYGAGDYVNAGTYAVTVAFSGSRSGKVTRDFTITPRTVTAASVELDANSAVYDGAEHRPTVVSVSDSLSKFVEGRDYTIAYGAGDYTAAAVYEVTATFKGNYAGTAVAAFEIVDDSKKDADIPPLADGATELTKEIREALAKFVDAAVLAKITTPELYREFRDWVLRVGIDAAKASTRAYESFRISSILSVAQLFDAEVLTLTLSESADGLLCDGCFCVSVSLRDVSVKGSEVQFQLKAATDAFADIVRRSNDVKNLKTGRISVSDVETVMDDDGKSVLLSVTCPDGTAGFLMLNIE